MTAGLFTFFLVNQEKNRLHSFVYSEAACPVSPGMIYEAIIDSYTIYRNLLFKIMIYLAARTMDLHVQLHCISCIGIDCWSRNLPGGCLDISVWI